MKISVRFSIARVFPVERFIISCACIGTLTEQINQGKGKIRKKRINGNEYYYEMTPYYDNETRNTKYHSKYLGKNRDGEIKKVRSVFPRTSYRYGEFVPPD